MMEHAHLYAGTLLITIMSKSLYHHCSSVYTYTVCTMGSDFPYILLTTQEVRLFTLLPGQRAKRLRCPLDNNSVNNFALHFCMKLCMHSLCYRYICVQPATPKVNKGHEVKVHQLNKSRFDTQISHAHQAIKSLLSHI